MSNCDEHEIIKARSTAHLQQARETAAKKRNYNSLDTHTRLERLFSEKSGFKPYGWQLDVAEAILLGLDCVVIAGTGSGKTIPFMLPLLLYPNKMALIISPLKVLQRDQARRFRKMKIAAVAVNGDTWSPTLFKDLVARRYNAILTSPEMCLKHPQFRKWLMTDDVMDAFLVTIVDEAHCISQWGSDFRLFYSMLGKLRAFLRPETPVLLTSATITPSALIECCATMNVNIKDAYFLNLGNHRQNIITSVIYMDSSKDYKAIQGILPDPSTISTPASLPKTLIFTNAVNLTQVVSRDLRLHYGASFHRHISFLHAHRTAKAKHRVMQLFQEGTVRILVATEAAGMGADIPDIELVIQFGVPSSLSIFNQRAGRAGRSPQIKARAVLLVERSMFVRKKKRKAGGRRAKKPEDVSSGSDDDSSSDSDDKDEGDEAKTDSTSIDDGKEWGKKVDEVLREYISTERCRTAVSDKHFNNPPRSSQNTRCENCDNCLNLCTTTALRPSTPSPDSPTATPSLSVHSTPSKAKNSNGKRRMTTTSGPSTRRGEHLQNARTALLQWRRSTYFNHYSPSPVTSAAILPDATLTTLASNRNIKTADDLQNLPKPWIFAEKHGAEVLELLEKLDKAEAADKLEKREQKKAATAQQQQADRERKRLKKQLPSASFPFTPPAPRPALADTTHFNIMTFPQLPAEQSFISHSPQIQVTPKYANMQATASVGSTSTVPQVLSQPATTPTVHRRSVSPLQLPFHFARYYGQRMQQGQSLPILQPQALPASSESFYSSIINHTSPPHFRD